MYKGNCYKTFNKLCKDIENNKVESSWLLNSKKKKEVEKHCKSIDYLGEANGKYFSSDKEVYDKEVEFKYCGEIIIDKETMEVRISLIGNGIDDGSCVILYNLIKPAKRVELSKQEGSEHDIRLMFIYDGVWIKKD